MFAFLSLSLKHTVFSVLLLLCDGFHFFFSLSLSLSLFSLCFFFRVETREMKWTDLRRALSHVQGWHTHTHTERERNNEWTPLTTRFFLFLSFYSNNNGNARHTQSTAHNYLNSYLLWTRWLAFVHVCVFLSVCAASVGKSVCARHTHYRITHTHTHTHTHT